MGGNAKRSSGGIDRALFNGIGSLGNAKALSLEESLTWTHQPKLPVLMVDSFRSIELQIAYQAKAKHLWLEGLPFSHTT